MNKIVVISAFLSLALGCAGGLKLDANSLLSREKDDPSTGSSEDAAGTPDTAKADPADAAEDEAPADPAAERRAYYQPKIDALDGLLQQIPECCQGEDFLLRMTAKYPSGPFVEEYKKALSNKLPRSGESQTPEWQAVEAKFEEIEHALVAAVRLPKDVYEGKDAKQVEKIFSDYAADHTKKPVVEVVLLNKDWDRKSGSNWQGDTMVKYDNGFMRGFVLVEGDAGKGEVWELVPRKDFLDGGKVKFDVYVPTKIADMMLPAKK